MEQAIKLLGLAISPRTIWDLVVYGLAFAVLSTLFFVKLGKSENRWRNALKSGLAMVALSLAYIFCFAYVIPIFQRFPEDKAGILIARFSGHTLQENLGGQNLNEAICQTIQSLLPEIEAKMDLPGVNAAIRVRAISWEVNSEKEAASMRRKYRAAAVLWGNVTRLKETAKFAGGFDSQPLPFMLNARGLPAQGIVFSLSTGPEFTIALADSGYNLRSWCREITYDFLPILAYRIYEQNPQLAAELVEKLPQVDPECKKLDIGGFLLFFAAQAFERGNRMDNALEYYGLSFDYLKKSAPRLSQGLKPITLLDRELTELLESDEQPQHYIFYDSDALKLPPCDTCDISVGMKRIMALAKWKEGYLLLKKGNTDRARQSLETAISVADSAFIPLILGECRRWGLVVDSVDVNKGEK